jgi:rod shape-determining protein MreD
MFKEILIIIIFFYLLVLLQTSFLIHFDIFLGKIVNYILILIPVVLIGLFASQKQYGFGAAFSAGFFLDIFSGQFIGISILIFVFLVFFINLLKRDINFPNLWINILKTKK